MIALRAMRPEDLLDVVAIERLCFGDRWNVQAFAGELENPASSYFVLTEEERVIGYAGYWLILDEAHITTIAVHPAAQRRYLGELLLAHLIAHAFQAGAKWLTLEVRVSNKGAQKLYEKYGFTGLGRRRGYYQDDGEDALVMWTENIWQDVYRKRFAALNAELRARFPTLKEA